MNSTENQKVNEIIPYNKISSGMIKEYNYHKESQILCITINDGFVYSYFEVPEQVIIGLRNSNEPGIFYKKNIRTQYRRLFKTFNLEVLKSD